MQLPPTSSGRTRSIVTTTLSLPSCLRKSGRSQRLGKDAPAKPVLVTTTPPSFETVCSAQSVHAKLGRNAPSSMRNLIGNVRPSTSPMNSPVFTFFNWLPLLTGSRSAKPKSMPHRDPVDQVLLARGVELGRARTDRGSAGAADGMAIHIHIELTNHDDQLEVGIKHAGERSLVGQWR